MLQPVHSAPSIGPPPAAQDPKEWERKQRAREYRVAARREKRNRKADEKKQRKLNATILRRMTRNPDKYNKNAERNRLRAIELERRNLWHQAVQQAQHLAAIHDPSGASFNVSPVIKLEDGSVITQEMWNRRQERQAQKVALKHQKAEGGMIDDSRTVEAGIPKLEVPETSPGSSSILLQNGLHPDRLNRVERGAELIPARKISKKQQKKLALYEPRPPPPKPTIPEGISLPEGEQNWLELWDLTEEQVERRVAREKKRKAADRKALRVKQQTGKAERRAARDEKRRVYRDIKLEWKEIKAEQVRERTLLKAVEDEESKKIAVLISIAERQAALELCASLGFTVENTPGTADIKPKALGMKGVDVDFDAIEKADRQGDIRPKANIPKKSAKRVDLSGAAGDANARYVSTVHGDVHDEGDEFIKLDVGDGRDFQTLSYNHKLRRKLRRALDTAEVRKEMLVRERAIEHLKGEGEDVPPVLQTPGKPLNVKGHRILDNGKLETSKQERVRSRMELTEFNAQMKVLRKQAKDAAIYAGLEKYAELMGRIPALANPGETGDVEVPETRVNSGYLAVGLPAEEHISGEKRSLSDSEDESSTDEEGQAQEGSNATSMSEESSDSASSVASTNENPGKRRKQANKEKSSR